MAVQSLHLLDDVRAQFFAESRSGLAEVRKFADGPVARRAACEILHQWAGSAGLVGCPELGKAASRLKRRIEGGKSPANRAVRELLSELGTRIAVARAEGEGS